MLLPQFRESRIDPREDRGLSEFLLLHLLGLKVPDDALAGLDGLLIGLRTRSSEPIVDDFSWLKDQLLDLWSDPFA